MQTYNTQVEVTLRNCFFGKNMKDKTHLYHCTNYNAIYSILTSGYFRPSYCLEEFSVFPDNHIKMAHAVVCFADLLSDEIQKHMNTFHSDSYIRMTKEWAIKKRLAPVIYYPNNSYISVLLKSIIEFAMERSGGTTNKTVKFTNATNLLMGFLKQYKGKYWDKKKNTFSEEVLFYTEREWRYLPLPKNKEAYYISEENFYDKEFKEKKLKELVDHGYILKFSWRDIEEIGVPISKKSELTNIISHLWQLKEKDVAEKIHPL